MDMGKQSSFLHVSVLNIDILIYSPVFYPVNFAVFRMQLLTGLLLSCVSILAPVWLQNFTGNITVGFDAWKNLANVLKHFSKICMLHQRSFQLLFVPWNKLLVQFYKSCNYLGLNFYSLRCFKKIDTTGEGALF